MENKNRADRLRRLAGMVENWTGDEIPAIEKDHVLAGLREIYDCIKFGGESCGAEKTAAFAPVADPAGNAEAPKPVDCVHPAEDADTAAGDNREAAADGGPSPETPDVQVPGPALDDAAPACERVDRAEPQTVPPVGGFVLDITDIPAERCTPGETDSYIVNSADEKEEFRENILFDREEIPAKPKLDKRAILSLYGDEPAPVRAETAPAHSEPAPADPADDLYRSASPEGRQPLGSAPGDNQPVRVLGDVLTGGGQTVSDVYAGQGETVDVASVIGSPRVDSLQRAIGINDKFLLIRNLFDGNAEIYESVITTLDGFTELDDALIYIHENFHWNPDSDAVRLLVDVLTRKLS